jgi:hypothetical protein
MRDGNCACGGGAAVLASDRAPAGGGEEPDLIDTAHLLALVAMATDDVWLLVSRAQRSASSADKFTQSAQA